MCVHVRAFTHTHPPPFPFFAPFSSCSEFSTGTFGCRYATTAAGCQDSSYNVAGGWNSKHCGSGGTGCKLTTLPKNVAGTNVQRCNLAFANTYPDLKVTLCGGAECTTIAQASAASSHYVSHYELYKGATSVKKGMHRAGAITLAACLKASVGAAEQCPVNKAPWFSSGRVFEIIKYEGTGILTGTNTKQMGLKSDLECSSLCKSEPGNSCQRFSNDENSANPGCVLTTGLNNCRCKAQPKGRYGKKVDSHGKLNCMDTNNKGHPWCYIVENEGCPNKEGTKYTRTCLSTFLGRACVTTGHGYNKRCSTSMSNVALGGTWRTTVAAYSPSVTSRIFTVADKENRECTHCGTDALMLSCIHAELVRKNNLCNDAPENQDFTNNWIFGESSSRNVAKIRKCKAKSLIRANEQKKLIGAKALKEMARKAHAKKALAESKRVARIGRAKALRAQLGSFGPEMADTWRDAAISDHKGAWSSTNVGSMQVYLNDVLLGETGEPTKLAAKYNTWTIDLTKHQLALLKPGINTVRVAAAAGAVKPAVIFAVIKAEVKAANGYLDCDGKTTFAQVKYNAHPALAKAVKSDFSVEAWVKLPSAKAISDDTTGRNTGGVVMSRGGNGAAFWTLYGSGKTGAGFRVNWADGVDKTTGAAVTYAETAVENYNLPNDEWFHYAAVFDDMFLGVYINGQRVAETEVPGGSDRVVAGYSVSTPLLIGAMDSARTVEDAQDKPTPTASAGSIFWGSIDDVVVWNEGRSGQQIAVDAATEQWGATVVANEAKKNVGQQDAATPDASATPKQDAGGGSMPIMAFDFDAEAGDSGAQDTATMDSSSVDGTEGIKVEVVSAAITRIYHAKEKHVWKDCPGAQLAAGETDIDICGGTVDSTGKVKGRCVLSEGTPRCFCSNGFKGRDCTTVVCAPDKNMGICSSAGLLDDERTRGSCKENSNWAPPADGVEVAKSLDTPDMTGPGWCEVRSFEWGLCRG